MHIAWMTYSGRTWTRLVMMASYKHWCHLYPSVLRQMRPGPSVLRLACLGLPLAEQSFPTFDSLSGTVCTLKGRRTRYCSGRGIICCWQKTGWKPPPFHYTVNGLNLIYWHGNILRKCILWLFYGLYSVRTGHLPEGCEMICLGRIEDF